MTQATTAPGATEAPSSALRSKALSGVLWNYGSFTYLKLSTLVTTIVLARHLTPTEFGLASLALIIINYLDTINNFGIGSSVIYDRDADDRTLSVAFWVSQGTGLLAFLVAVATAPLTAAWFDQPRLVGIQVVLGSVFLLSSLSSIHDARLRRGLAWRRRMPADLSRTTAKTAVAITFAVLGFGAWSLVFSQLAGALVFLLVITTLLRWRPKMVWDRAVAGRQVRYGSQIMLTTVFALVLKDADYFVIGAYLSTQDLGFYTLGFRLPDLAIMGITWSLSASTFPLFSRLQDDREALRRAVLKIQRALAALLVPLAAVLCAGASDIVGLLYGDRWGPTASVTPLIAVYSLMSGLSFVSGDALKAIGRVRVINIVNLVRLPIVVGVLWATAPHGIVPVAVAQVVLMAVNFVVQLAIMQGMLGLPVGRVLAGIVPSVVAAAGLVAVMVGINHLQLGHLATLALGVPLGLIAYAALSLLLQRDLVVDVLETLGRAPYRPRRKREPGGKVPAP